MKKLIVTLALVAGAFTTQAMAQCGPFILTEQQISLSCQIINGQKVYVDPVTGQQYSSLINNGNGTFTAAGNTVTPCQQNFNATGLNTTTNDPVLGLITTTLDPTRQASKSSIRSLSDAGGYPAIEDLYFHANVTIASNPGVTYRTINEVHLQGIINSFNPHRGETLRLVAPVRLEDVRRPGAVAYTLQNVSVTLN
jgi:hypothetical protein